MIDINVQWVIEVYLVGICGKYCCIFRDIAVGREFGTMTMCARLLRSTFVCHILQPQFVATYIYPAVFID